MEKYVMEALFAIGHGDYALERAHKRYAWMVDHPDHDTLFEHWDVGVSDNWRSGSVNHAWSGGPLAVIPSRMLGIVPTKPGWTEFSVSPGPVVFDKCSISFPTVQGTVAVSYDKAAGVMEVTVPEGSRADVVVPGSYAHTSLGPGKHKVSLKVPEPVAAGTYPFQDAGLPVEKRVKDLLKRMSVVR